MVMASNGLFVPPLAASPCCWPASAKTVAELPLQLASSMRRQIKTIAA
jgi:hypothetical protein